MIDHTIAAIATPLGEGGIHIIRLSGQEALSIVGGLFQAQDGTPTESLEPQRAYFGELRDPGSGQPVDEILLLFFRGPRSYTCEDVVEIHCHGGAWVTSRILQLVLDAGARIAEPGEFTRRAFLNGRLDLTQAEAVADIIHAASNQGLSSALAQLKGKLSERLNESYNRLLAVLSQLEVAIDFPEEGLEFEIKKELEKQVDRVQQGIDQLTGTFRQGRIFREGLRVALVGKPNVGKSSLLNALLQEDRAIVTPHPGTTRDVLEERVRIRDIHMVILDTAGLRHAPQPIEEQGIARTRATLEQADLALMLFDGSQPLDDNDDLLIQEVADKSKLAVLNKSDLPQKIDATGLLNKLAVDSVVTLSAATGNGLDTLMDRIHDHAMGGRTPGQEVVITRERHRQALEKTSQALGQVSQSLSEDRSEDLVAVDLNMALDHLGSLLGKTLMDDLLDRIFSDFCIGK